MYFQKFPIFGYKFAGDLHTTFVVDIIKRVKVHDNVITEASLYDLYNIVDGETPDIVAATHYNDSNLHWVILLTNQIIDPFFDWPLSSNVLKDYVIEKYEDVYDTHHYELRSPNVDRNGMVMPLPDELVDYGPEFVEKLFDSALEMIIPITNFEYEEALNDAKREIKLFKRELIPALSSEMTKLLGVRNG